MTVISWYPGSAPMGRELKIRRVKGTDAPAIAELRALWSTGAPPELAFIGSIRTWLETEGEARITLMASVGEQPVGMVSMLEYRGMPKPGGRSSRWGYVDHLFVKDGERRQGVGTALISEAMVIADSRDYPKLLVTPNAMALSLFHRLGFLLADELGPEGILLFRPKPRAAGE